MPRDDILVDLIEALAEADGIERTDLDYKLSDYIDPEVLERLGEGGVWELSFRVSDHHVRITHRDTIFIDGVNYTDEATLHE